MSLMNELREAQALTDREIDIRNYFLDHPENVLNMSSRQIGEATFTSASTITRFCQKFGYGGWSDFRLRFISDLKSDQGTQTNENPQLSERENMVTLLQKVSDAHDHALNTTRKELSLTQLIRIQKLLLGHPYIDFYAYDANLHLARYASSQFFHAGKIAVTYAETNAQVLNVLASQPGHLAIIISHTGENIRLIELAKLLRRNGVRTIIITSGKDTTLAHLADEFLYAPSPHQDGETDSEKFGTPIFATAAKYLLDLMFSILFSGHYGDNVRLNLQYDAIGSAAFWPLKDQK